MQSVLPGPEGCVPGGQGIGAVVLDAVAPLVTPSDDSADSGLVGGGGNPKLEATYAPPFDHCDVNGL